MAKKKINILHLSLNELRKSRKVYVISIDFQEQMAWKNACDTELPQTNRIGSELLNYVNPKFLNFLQGVLISLIDNINKKVKEVNFE